MKASCQRIAPALALAVLLGGCGSFDWLGEAEAPPLPGERISVLQLDQALEPDPQIADLAVRLPPPWRNADWSQSGGLANNAMHHLELPYELKRAWRASAGDGSSRLTRLLSSPVVVGERIFTLDAEATLSAFDTNNGTRLWHVDLTPENEDSGALGGGLAIENGVVYATTGYGNVHALNASDGSEVWRRNIGLPFRAPPTAADGRVFVISYDNQLHALSASDGEVLWTHSGIPENAGLIGGAGAAVDGDIVVAPYTSGELVALRVQNGRLIWGDQLVRVARSTPLAALNDIRGRPVIDRDMVFAISHSGRMVAIDLRGGGRVWDRDITGVETPWVAGDFIYLVTTQAEVLCLSRRDGRIRWVSQLPRFEDEKDQEDPIQWSGPVLVSDRLVLVSSDGRAVSLSPYTGDWLGSMDLPDGVLIAPVVADGTLYIYTDDADLIALK